MKNYYLLFGLLVFVTLDSLQADYTVSQSELSKIEADLASLNETQLKDRQVDLSNKIYSLESELENTQSPAKSKTIRETISLLNAELS